MNLCRGKWSRPKSSSDRSRMKMIWYPPLKSSRRLTSLTDCTRKTRGRNWTFMSMKWEGKSMRWRAVPLSHRSMRTLTRLPQTMSAISPIPRLCYTGPTPHWWGLHLKIRATFQTAVNETGSTSTILHQPKTLLAHYWDSLIYLVMPLKASFEWTWTI